MASKVEPVLPLGDKVSWDKIRATEDGTEIKSVSESCVLLQSLKQSRDNWLRKTFPKFSSKARGNKDPAPPPHTIQARGTCDLAVGPHIFPETVFYEVHYLPPAHLSTQSPTVNPYWHPTYVPPPQATAPQQSPMTTGTSTTTNTATIGNVTTATPAPAPLDSIPSSIALTPNLIQQVNYAASSNPILANLLQLAAAGNATPAQLQTLGILIQSFANLNASPTPNVPVASSSSTPHGYYQPTPFLPVKEFDLVLEFQETPNERWIFPRVPVYTERQPAPNSPNDLDVSMLARVPFVLEPPTAQQPGPTQYPVAFILRKAPYTLWDTVWRWVGAGEKNEANKAQIESFPPAPRLYIGHQLPAGSLLSQFQAAAAPQYTMKLLKQGPPTQSRSRPKRSRKDTEPVTKAGTSTPGETATSGDAVVVKRSRTTQAKPTPPIQCLSCKNSEVPLILGGKYCRPCAEIEKQKVVATQSGTPEVPQAGPSSSTSTT